MSTSPVTTSTTQVLGGRYTLEEQEAQQLEHVGRVRTFMATGPRGAKYGCLLYVDGRFHWFNAARVMGTVPFDLAQLSPASLLS